MSVSQFFTKQIMTGKKNIEYLRQPTKIRGRVYIYATKSPWLDVLEEIDKKPCDYDLGVLVGTVEIIDCKKKWWSAAYHWILANPQRLEKLIEPKRRPQPVWFKPFDEK
ncbi:MAG TPA: ASCH domain-containing protein [Nitrosomonas sp.]|nr:ASCH domain-containing protein [Nitrosomonas sp.]